MSVRDRHGHDSEREGDAPPPRWLDAGDAAAGAGPSVDQRIGKLLRRLPPADELSPARLGAVRTRVAARAGGRGRRGVRAWAWALAGLLLLLGGGVVGAARGWLPTWKRAPGPVSPSVVPAPLPARAKVRRAVAPAVDQEPGAVVEAAPVAAAPAEAPATAAIAAPSPSPAPRRAVARAALPGAVVPRAEGEAELLASALAALRRRRDPQQALRVLDRYDERFAGGLLAAEAARLRVDALLSAHDTAAARRLLDVLTLTGAARDVELGLIRGELRASDGDCAGAIADFDRVLAQSVVDGSLAARARAGRRTCGASPPERGR